MDSRPPGASLPLGASLRVDGLSVDVVTGLHAASLRYFEPRGDFASRLQQLAGRELPQALRACTSPGDGMRCALAWRSPTETLLLSNDAGAFADYQQELAAAADGCMVDQTGGLIAIRVRGSKAPDLMQRLGSDALMPGEGAALAGRLAEISVLTLCPEAGTLLLVVERVYLDHLMRWIEITIADWRTDGG